MLPIRLGIVTAIAALCLWGLFSLLDSLQKPALLRSAKTVIVKGCESLDSAETREQCPALFCQKALLDAKLVPRPAHFEVTTKQARNDGWLIAGTAKAPSASAPLNFSCEVIGTQVARAVLVDPADQQNLVR